MTGDYPRWMFHREHEMKLVQNEEEEATLGPGWTRTIQAAAPSPAEKPAPHYDPEPEDEPVYDPDWDNGVNPEEQPQERAAPVPARKKKR